MWTKNIDNELLILEVLLDYYEKSGAAEIRRVRLKELCEDALYAKTNRAQSAYGGAFQRGLDALEEKMAVKRTRKGLKLTLLNFDIHRVRSLLLDRKYAQFVGDHSVNTREHEVPPNIWEKIIEPGLATRLDDRTKNLRNFSNEIVQQSYLPIKELLIKLQMNLASSLFGFYIKHQNAKFELNEDNILNLGKVAYEIASKNQQERFELMIEYKGRPNAGAILGRIFVPDSFKNIIPKYFAQWADDTFNYEVSKEDREKLSKIEIDSLSPTAKDYWNIFYESLKQYLHLSPDANQ